MENQNENIRPEVEETEVPESQYVPRPMWQVWCARVALVLFIIFVIYQLLTIAGGGR